MKMGSWKIWFHSRKIWSKSKFKIILELGEDHRVEEYRNRKTCWKYSEELIDFYGVH